MTKREVAIKVSKKTGLELNDILFIIQEFLNVIKEELINGGSITFLNFGKFILKERPGRIVQDIVRSKPMWMNPFKYIYFKPSDKLRKEVKKNNTRVVESKI